MSRNPEEQIPETSAVFESLISKDRELINLSHDNVVETMLRDPIPVEPNIGELGDLFENVGFSDLPTLQAKYRRKWENISDTLKKYLGQKGGKRLRPLFFLNGYRMFSHGKQPDKKILSSAVGVELLHETSLILDDVMDNSELRRGAPSLWASIATRINTNPEDAKKIAIDLSPLCFSWTRHLIIDETEENTQPQVEEIFWRAVNDAKRGQTFDVESARSNEWPDLDEAIDWSYLKTIPYSVELPLFLAFYAAKVPEDKRQDTSDGIKMFTRGFGLAFQLHDDLLILRTDKETGKDSMADAMNCSKIPLAILTRQLGNNEQKAFLDLVWGHGDKLTLENTEKLKRTFKETGALQMIVQRISQEVQNAKEGLAKIKTTGFDISAFNYFLDEGFFWMEDLNLSAPQNFQPQG